MAGTVQLDYVPVQNSLRVTPQQPIDNIRRTIGLDEVDFAQSPSPWTEPDPPGVAPQKTYELSRRPDGQPVRSRYGPPKTGLTSTDSPGVGNSRIMSHGRESARQPPVEPHSRLRHR